LIIYGKKGEGQNTDKIFTEIEEKNKENQSLTLYGKKGGQNTCGILTEIAEKNEEIKV
jgi:hypothetical protein